MVLEAMVYLQLRFCLGTSDLSYLSQRLHALRNKCFQMEKKMP